jgi:hypothetical protein
MVPRLAGASLASWDSPEYTGSTAPIPLVKARPPSAHGEYGVPEAGPRDHWEAQEVFSVTFDLSPAPQKIRPRKVRGRPSLCRPGEWSQGRLEPLA